MECMLCLELIQDVTKCIEVDSVQEFDIKQLIDKYLWNIESVTEDYICHLCSKELNGFHNFFTRIEDAHNRKKILLATETDPLKKDSKPPKDLHETLLESEIQIDILYDMPTVIKQENIESAIVSINENSMDNNCDIPEEDFNDFIEYDGGNSDDSKDFDIKDDDEKTPSTKSVAVNSSTFKPKNNTSSKTYHYSKTNQLEYDNFLKEHFEFSCNKCQLPFDRFRTLIQHYRKEHNEQGYAICCETKFFNRRLLVDHINCHLNPDYFKCTICDKAFTKRMCLLSHLRLHEGKRHCCNVCGKKFVQKFKLEKHKLTHLPESEKKFPCKECEKSYADEYMLTRHQRIVHLNVYAKICEICGQLMPDAYTFKRHMEKHNGIPPPTSKTCDICGLTVTCVATLKLHKELKHSVDGKRDFNCHICQKVSPNMRALKKHIRESHEIGYQYKCTVCPKEFKRSDNFKAHMATHTGTPLYRCPWCPKEFNANGSMHKHRKTVHPLEWEEEKRKKYSGNLPPNYKRHSNGVLET